MHDKRLYLHLGNKVIHQSYEQWGAGTVVEEMTSSVPGGTCLVRVRFQDGRQRTFNNDLDNEMCCYYFGVRRCLGLDVEEPAVPHRPVRRRLR